MPDSDSSENVSALRSADVADVADTSDAPPPYRAILWDMDGTLSDSEPLHYASLVAALRHFGEEPDDALHAQTFGMTGRASYEFCVARYGRAFDFATWSQVRFETFIASLEHLRAREGALELCRAAQHAGLYQAVVSNAGRNTLESGIAALALGEYLTVAVCAHDVEAGKPAPDGYLLAAERLGVTPAQAVVVEDSPLGAQAGVAAGMRVVAWLDAGSDPGLYPEAAQIVRTSKQLAEALGLSIDVEA
ncbi:HAD family hydrolase [Burkholderia sp. Ac-20379]|uniref:HAD family hydrolase n=1 Tax=Burkholderia sp. Ac-20379 TaxID=2703900 RepID=UPI00197CFEE8|nr:HAD family phosphatase [Burkholderia sp. Ac-20379]MBN3723162.1 HAD family phosphatase [Burkholderia sp. Ac-20379]